MKYLIKASFEVDGRVDKHDVIGAVFGQTEGLLGSDFNLEQLQNKDKIGRVHIDMKYQGTKSVGILQIPSNLDRVETVLLAAMIESVDRVGPYNSRINIDDIQDLRIEKLQKIVERARQLLQRVKEQEPDIKEILRQISQKPEVQPKVIEIGEEKLPAGPDVEKADTIIIVEGRADVINLMKYGYTNTVALEGAREKVPKTIVELAKNKKVIAFVDGDRGGDLILKNLLDQVHVDYVARAPKGMEVEQLTGKEIARSLSQMMPAEAVKQQLLSIKETKEEAEAAHEQTLPEVQTTEEKAEEKKEEIAQEVSNQQVLQEIAKGEQKSESISQLVVPKQVIDNIKNIKGTLEAIIYDRDWKEITRIKVRDLFTWLDTAQPNSAYAIIFDGIITQRILDLAGDKGIVLLIGARMGSKISSKRGDVKFATFSDLT
ncbi:MAG: DNA primase [Caldisphaera sp.]|uniref:DNA primase DnaG n=1 Tax=Caldisphaera sp. TaxID=2060322 RepID=UPI000CB1D3EB|nr:MAG: DNA primase [Caldisphaera sp.]PMP92335.1 MAG: DNA primase [Caldisphaera sp.]